jgi:hypothetical protein
MPGMRDGSAEKRFAAEVNRRWELMVWRVVNLSERHTITYDSA